MVFNKSIIIGMRKNLKHHKITPAFISFSKEIRQKRGDAFTLVELLVVISIIALLVSILMPALGKAREQAKRSVCANNLHQFAISLTMFTSNNNDKFPTDTVDTIRDDGNYSIMPFWLWNIHSKVVEVMLDNGTIKEQFYCPSNPMIKNMDIFWEHEQNGEFWMRTGYGWLLKKPKPTKIKPAYFTGNRSYIASMTVDHPADKELVVDLVMDNNGDFGKLYVWGYITPGHVRSTSHYSSPGEPAGGNILFVDGHVEWRNFSEMEIGLDATVVTPGPPTSFWW